MSSMKMIWLLVLLISSHGISEGASRNEVVNVGAIFSLSSVNGKVSKIAIEAAEKDVNSDPSVVGGRKLSISIHDANYSGLLGITGAMKYMVSETVAIIGPQDATMAHTLSHLSNELHVPLLSYTALDPALTTLQYPYFIQTAPNDQFQMTAIADIIAYYGWHDIVLVYTDDDQFRNSMIALGDKLEEKGSRISSKLALPPYPTATRTQVQDAMSKIKMMESRVIVLCTFSKTGFLVFEVAQSFRMMEAGFVWITTSWLSTVMDSLSPLPSKTASSIQGVLTLRLHTPDSRRKLSFISNWNKLCNGSIGLNTYGLYAYDTVWMIAKGLKQLFDHNGTISFSKDTHNNSLGHNGESLDFSSLGKFDEGKELLSNLLNISMIGLTGPIKFLDRSPLNPSYDILNVVKSGMKRVGYWSNHSGLSLVAPETMYGKSAHRSKSSPQLRSIMWPGGSRIKPRGWVLPLDGRRLRIGIPHRVSYQEFVTPGNGNGTVKGYCIDVFTAAIRLLPYVVNYDFVLFGNGEKNPSYFDLVNNVALKKFDAAVGDIAIVTSRTKVVDFTQPYIDSGLVMLVPVKKLSASPLAFFRPFSPMMWVAIAGSFLLVGFVVWILEHRKNDEFRGHPRTQFVTILWFGFSTLFFSHRENVVSSLGRCVLIVWLFVVLIVNSSYTASLTSIFTVQLASPITGIDSLISGNVHIGFQVGSFAESYLREQLSIQKSRLIALGSPEEYAAALKNGTVGAIIDEQPYIDLFLTKHCDFSIRGEQFTKSGWGFAFPRDSPLATDLSTAILTLSESGDLQKIHDKWLSKKSCSTGDDSDLQQLHLQNFIGLFSICAAVCLFALLLHFLFTMYQFNRHLKRDPEPSTSAAASASAAGAGGGLASSSTRLKKFLAFSDKKRDRKKKTSYSKRKLDDDAFSSDRHEDFAN